MSRALGLDLSTQSIGWSIVQDGGQCLAAGELLPELSMPKSKAGLWDRLLPLYDAVLLLITVWSMQLDLVAVEEANYTRNAVTQRGLVSMLALVQLAVRENHLPCLTVHNATWKAALGVKLLGVGRDDQKAAIREAILNRFGSLAIAWSQDTCDATGVASYASVPHAPPAPKTHRRKQAAV